MLIINKNINIRVFNGWDKTILIMLRCNLLSDSHLANIVESLPWLSNLMMHVFQVLSGLNKAMDKIADEVGKPGVDLLKSVDAL